MVNRAKGDVCKGNPKKKNKLVSPIDEIAIFLETYQKIHCQEHVHKYTM